MIGDVTAVREFIKREGMRSLHLTHTTGHHVVNKSSKNNIFPLHQAAKLGSCEVRKSLELSDRV
jgi:hypothetical protein